MCTHRNVLCAQRRITAGQNCYDVACSELCFVERHVSAHALADGSRRGLRERDAEHPFGGLVGQEQNHRPLLRGRWYTRWLEHRPLTQETLELREQLAQIRERNGNGFGEARIIRRWGREARCPGRLCEDQKL